MYISQSSLLLFSLLLSGQSAAISQKIPAAEDLQGNWKFTEDGQTQPVTLIAVPDKTTEGFQLHFTAQPQITAWRPARRHCVSYRRRHHPLFFFCRSPGPLPGGNLA
ncbi:hypothetical protein NWE50_19415 [Morganella morganii]|nr:hypothetical protein [Morganella morganii]